MASLHTTGHSGHKLEGHLSFFLGNKSVCFSFDWGTLLERETLGLQPHLWSSLFAFVSDLFAFVLRSLYSFLYFHLQEWGMLPNPQKKSMPCILSKWSDYSFKPLTEKEIVCYCNTVLPQLHTEIRTVAVKLLTKLLYTTGVVLWRNKERWWNPTQGGIQVAAPRYRGGWLPPCSAKIWEATRKKICWARERMRDEVEGIQPKLWICPQFCQRYCGLCCPLLWLLPVQGHHWHRWWHQLSPHAWDKEARSVHRKGRSLFEREKYLVNEVRNIQIVNEEAQKPRWI